MPHQPNSRRSYGTGQLFVHADATGREAWYGRWYSGGRRIKRRIGPKREPGTRHGLTRSQAEAELRRRIQAQAPLPVAAEGLTIAEAGEQLVASLEARGRKASTLAAAESNLKAHLVPFFGARPLARIETSDVEAFIASRRSRSSPKSISNYLGTLHSIFEFARVRPNPVADARKPEPEATDPDIHFLSEVEVEALLRAVPDDHMGPTDRALYLAATMSGLRQGELFGLRWRDIDWGAMRIRVRRSYARKRAGREAQFGRPKSKRSSRSVPMHDRLGAELERHFQRSAFNDDEDLVFCHPHTGKPLDSSNALGRLRDALAAAGVRRIRFHDLRHTFGTRMAAAGVPMRTLQEWLGHRDIATTMIYADYSPSDQEHELVERAFRGPIRGPNLRETQVISDNPSSPEQAESAPA
jgi:integrase